jgi:hypothetical protein
MAVWEMSASAPRLRVSRWGSPAVFVWVPSGGLAPLPAFAQASELLARGDREADDVGRGPLPSELRLQGYTPYFRPRG